MSSYAILMLQFKGPALSTSHFGRSDVCLVCKWSDKYGSNPFYPAFFIAARSGETHLN